MNDDTDRRLVAAVTVADRDATAQALAGGANPNTSMGRFHGSVLGEAARAGAASIVELLLDAGADVEPTSRGRTSPLRTAVQGSHVGVVRLLLARGALGLEDPVRPSVLTDALTAAWFNPTPTTLATLRELLAAGATTSPTEEPLLVAAVMRGVAPAALRILIEHGADPDTRRSDATPVLVLAARCGDHGAVDVLVEAGATVDALDARGRTALMHAVERNHRHCAAVLLLAGADGSKTTSDGTSALQLARGWQWQSVQLMLGEHSVGRDNVPITRTAMRLTPTGIRLAGDPTQFHLLADVVDLALADLGDDEWQMRTGTSADVARQLTARLRNEPVSSATASWHHIDAGLDEYAIIRGGLLELAYGTTKSVPAGTTRLQIIDLFEELTRQTPR